MFYSIMAMVLMVIVTVAVIVQGILIYRIYDKFDNTKQMNITVDMNYDGLAEGMVKVYKECLNTLTESCKEE